MGKIIISIFLIIGFIFSSYAEKFPVSIEAKSIHKEPDGRTIASGDVVVRYKGKILKADKIIYDTKRKIIELFGNITVKTERFFIKGKEGWIDEKGKNGEFKNIEGIVNSRYYIKAEKMIKKGKEYIFYNGEYSTCSFKNYDWYLKTKKGIFIENDRVRFYNVSLRFFDIPVIYSPYYSYPTSSRKTGFLFPEIGSDSYNDFKYVQPIFFVLTRHSDMTFTLDYRNQQGKGFNLEYRNRFSYDSYYTGNFTVFMEDKKGKWWEGRDTTPIRNRWRVNGESEIHLEDFDISFVYDIPSDPYFFEDIYNSSDLRYKSYTKTQLIALMDKKPFTLEINFDYLYDLTKTDNSETLQRLPEVRFYLKKAKPFPIPFYFDFLSVDTYFYRGKGISGLRSDNTINFELYNNFSGFSNLLTFSPRGTWYFLSEKVEGNKSPTRNIFRFEDRLRYTILKEYKGFVHSIIPEVKLYKVSKVNQENLPYFDREDRVQDAKDLDFSIFNILNFDTDDFMSWEISTGYTFKNYYYLGSNKLEGHKKPLKNRIYFNINGFSGENTFYYDFHYNQIVRTITSFTIPIKKWATYSISHSFDKGLFEGSQSLNQINQSISIYIKNITLSGSVLNNIKDGYIQRKTFDFIYDRKCWRLKISYLEDFNRETGKTFSAIYVYINILRTDLKLPFVSRTL